MKGLLLKDFYTLAKQTRIFIALILVFSCMPSNSMTGFAVIYSGLLPITALAYDERSKWNQLAAMMPYSIKNIVLSKYVLGYIAVSGAAILTMIVQAVINLVKRAPFDPESYLAIVIVVCFAFLLQSVNMPFMFQLGVEKGRLVFFVLIALFVVAGMTFGYNIVSFLRSVDFNLPLILIATVLFTIVINILSIKIAIRLYQRKDL